MPTIYELYKLDNYVLSGSKSILAAAGVTASFAQQDSSTLSTPRVELQSVVGSQTGHVKMLGGKAVYDSWNVNLNVLVVTERTNNANFHSEFSSKVLSVLSDVSNYNSGSVLPYHNVAKVDFGGSVPRVETDDNKDVSALSFVLSVWIKPSAWPQ